MVRSQAEALEGNTHYDFCFVTTKCLPDVKPTPELLKDAIASGKIGAWTLLQVRWPLHKLSDHAQKGS